MNQQLVPQSPMPPVNPAAVAQQLVQALGMIAQTQQQILNELSAQRQVPIPVSSGYTVTSFFSWSSKRDQYRWLYTYGLQYNLDGTPKTQAITASDIEQHRELLIKFWATYDCR